MLMAGFMPSFFYSLAMRIDDVQMDFTQREQLEDGSAGNVLEHTRYIARPWPLFFLTGLVLAQPWIVIYKRVMYSGHEAQTVHLHSSHRNMWQATKSIWREGGIRAFYAGFMPFAVATTLYCHA